VIVSRVAPGTPADLCLPRLSEGDQVLFINGRDISQHTHAQVSSRRNSVTVAQVWCHVINIRLAQVSWHGIGITVAQVCRLVINIRVAQVCCLVISITAARLGVFLAQNVSVAH